MNTCRTPSEFSSDRFCLPSARPDQSPPPTTDPILRLWRPPPHSYDLATGTGTYISSSYCQDPAFTPDARAKSTPPCDHPRPIHQVYPSPPLTDAALASTVPLPDLPVEPSEARVGRPDREEIVDENMSHDGARHIAPLSPPPTDYVGPKELPIDGWNQGGGHGIECWRYGVNSEDGGAPAPPFPPVRDDSGFEEFGIPGGCEGERQGEGSHDDQVMIEPMPVWSPQSPISLHEDLPLAELPPFGGESSSGPSGSPFDPVPFAVASGPPLTWVVDSEMNWTASPSSTVFDELPPSPKPGALSLDFPDFGVPLGFDHHSQLQQQHSPISPLEIPFHHEDRHWFGGGSYGEPSGFHAMDVASDQHPSFLQPFNTFPLHPPPVDVDVDLESEYSDTVMPSDDEDSATLPPSSPRRRPLNDLYDATPPHGDLCPTPAPHSPHSALLSLDDFDMEDPGSPHSPHPALPELEDADMQPPSPESHAPLVATISPSLLGGSPPPEREGLGLFLQSFSIDPPLARSPSPTEDELQFIEVQLDPASTDLPNDEFLQLRALRKNALQQEREARRAESELSERVTVAASALLPPAEGSCGVSPTDLDLAEKRARKRELHVAMDMRAEARRVRKLQKQRSKEIGALLDLKMQTPISPMEGMPPLVGGGKAWTRSIAHLIAHMVLRRHDRARPLENRPPPDSSLRRKSSLQFSVSADDLLALGTDDEGLGVDMDCDMEE
ncbi:hypothetical protein VTO73DRAFT_14067 [Trametes versicolor]